MLVLASVQGSKASPEQRPVYFMGFALLLGPIAFFVVSHVASPIFLPRYQMCIRDRFRTSSLQYCL